MNLLKTLLVCATTTTTGGTTDTPARSIANEKQRHGIRRLCAQRHQALGTGGEILRRQAGVTE